MSTSDPIGSRLAPEASAAGPARMDVQTSQQMVREMTTLTSAMFSLLQPERAPVPETTTRPEAAPGPPAADIVTAALLPELSVPSIPLPDLPVTATEAPVAPQPPATAPVTSIPLPSLPVPDLPPPVAQAEPEPEATEDEDQPAKDSRQLMALMNEIAFLDD